MATAAARQTGGSVRVTLWILLIVYIFNFIDRQIVNILAEPIRYEDFSVHLPDGPGLGVALDEDRVAHFRRDRGPQMQAVS